MEDQNSLKAGKDLAPVSDESPRPAPEQFPIVAHQCEDGGVRPYPSLVCSHCRLPKTELAHFTLPQLCHAINVDKNAGGILAEIGFAWERGRRCGRKEALEDVDEILCGIGDKKFTPREAVMKVFALVNSSRVSLATVNAPERETES